MNELFSPGKEYIYIYIYIYINKIGKISKYVLEKINSKVRD